MRVDGAAPRGLWPPVGGGLCRRVVKGKVLRIDRPDGRRVLKFDGPSGRGLWWRLTPQIKKRGAAPPYPAAPDFPPKGETTHYDLCVAGAPSNHVRCTSTGKRVT